ncbi:hypothetical protein TNCV_1589951 [Trichonephila clavipes]|uniref:Uncharacterized protein n=1 Tax=Trichonephila clavipes TaxID=2585209 RepID=A0A8X6RK43_TRICX|nr:hypothetical protein TNCV_1589951 [Trichonephila clavipes]
MPTSGRSKTHFRFFQLNKIDCNLAFKKHRIKTKKLTGAYGLKIQKSAVVLFEVLTAQIIDEKIASHRHLKTDEVGSTFRGLMRG